mgnify:CR=1 FL=1
MKRLINVLILSSVLLASCGVSQNVPKKLKRASKKLEKHSDAITKLVNVYPELMDSLTIVSHDTITIKEHTSDTSFIAVTDTAFIDKILYEFLSEDSIITVEKIRYVRNEIIKGVLIDTTFFYEDSILATTIIFNKGKIYTSTVVKGKKIAYVTHETTLNPKLVKQPAYKNTWFWIMLLIIIVLLYLIRQNTYLNNKSSR